MSNKFSSVVKKVCISKNVKIKIIISEIDILCSKIEIRKKIIKSIII